MSKVETRIPLEQERVEAMFEFALSANYLRSLSRDADAKEIRSDQPQRVQILKNVYDRFFCEDALQPIELSNLVSVTNTKPTQSVERLHESRIVPLLIEREMRVRLKTTYYMQH